MADSWMVLRLTRSRLWIGLLGTLLVGIVGLNVMALSFNASSSKTAGISDELRRENSALRAEIAGGLSNERLQAAAAQRGLVVPEPGAIRYLDPSAADAAAAAARLRKGEITFGAMTPTVPVAPVIPPPETALEPATTEPATVDPTVADAVATTPETTIAPATPAVSTAGGGLTAP